MLPRSQGLKHDYTTGRFYLSGLVPADHVHNECDLTHVLPFASRCGCTPTASHHRLDLAELQTLQGLGIGITVGITPPAGLRIGLASWIRTLDLAELLTLQGERSNHSAIRQPG